MLIIIIIIIFFFRFYSNGQKVLPSKQRRLIEQATFTYHLLGKTSKKEVKTTKFKGKNAIENLEGKPN